MFPTALSRHASAALALDNTSELIAWRRIADLLQRDTGTPDHAACASVRRAQADCAEMRDCSGTPCVLEMIAGHGRHRR